MSSVTATRVCVRDASHTETETAAAVVEIVQDESCEETGKTLYTASFVNPAFAEQSRTLDEPPAAGHDWAEPEYEWAEDLSSVTATRVCRSDPAHVETETAETVTEIVLDETCEETGKTLYTASFVNPAFAEQSRTLDEPPAAGHDWAEPEYEWAEDLSSVTATRVCRSDPAHVQTETAETAAEITRDPSCVEYGETTYSASFVNPAFAGQIMSVDNIDPLGHTWVDATHTVPKTCSVCGVTDGDPLPIHYFPESFTEFRAAFNEAYPGFLKISTNEDTGFLMKIKGKSIDVSTMYDTEARVLPPIYLTHQDEFAEAPDWYEAVELPEFNMITITHYAPSEAFDRKTASNIARIGCKIAEILDPELTEEIFNDALGDAAAEEGQTLSFSRDGFEYRYQCGLDESGVYRYDFTVTLTENLE